jgi:hypothetical protein
MNTGADAKISQALKLLSQLMPRDTRDEAQMYDSGMALLDSTQQAWQILNLRLGTREPFNDRYQATRPRSWRLKR